ncbi:hypothetical protein [Bacillus sp. FJAT-28004]|uniref:hypothetical protein n=1 Tax=Bacillus sp. FJAT-28004 TaxID=1679165 RepID=UPI0006B3FFF4|nr:hypothetical protein [Bacillus sp. FJAT-28004]
MSKIVELRKTIVALLKKKHPKIYYEIAPAEEPYPIVVYDLPNAFGSDESTEIFVLHVDAWDAPDDGDTLPLEMLIDELNAALNKQVIRTNGMAFSFHRDTRLPLTDPDKRLRGRRLIYQVRTFGGD